MADLAPAASFETAVAVLAAQPFNDVVGAEITRFENGEAILELPIADRHRQQYGLVHGGVLAYLADNALTFACGSTLGNRIITTGLSITYVAGARDGVLRATGQVVASTGTIAVATVTVEEIAADGSTRTCAAGQGTATVTETSRRG